MREMTAEELEIYNNIMKSGSRKTGKGLIIMNNNDFIAMIACLSLISLAFIGCNTEKEQNDTPETWKDRLIKEYTDLHRRYRRLDKFMSSENAREQVSCAEFERLATQRNAMFDYLSVLVARLKASGIEIPKDLENL